MNKQERQILYSIVGLFGGLIFMNQVLPINYEFKLIFTLIGGFFSGFVGYKLATK